MIYKILLPILLISCYFTSYAQENSGTPYSSFGYGYLPDNTGNYTAMGGVSAAKRSSNQINFLNPASYSALDSARFYFQLATIGEYGRISNKSEGSSYVVSQNSYLNMAYRLKKDLFMSIGFTNLADIGYDILYTKHMGNDDPNAYFHQNISGEGGINNMYFGFGWKHKNLSLGVNLSYLFGKIERRESITSLLEASYYIRTSDKINVKGFVVTPGIQYEMPINTSSKLTLGTSFNFTHKVKANREFVSYKINTSANSGSTILDEEILETGKLTYPFAITSGFDYAHENKWTVAGDYTFNKMSAYSFFGENQDMNNYHRINMGGSWTPEEYGRFFRQRMTYMFGGYFTRTAIHTKGKDLKCGGLTTGVTMPFVTQRGGELFLGITLDMGIRGTEQVKLVKEKYAKLKIDLAFKEFWFIKRKIH